jgi:hypothetical protein
MADEHGNIKSQDTQTQTDYYPKIEKRVIQIRLVHAVLTALVFAIGMIVSTTLFINSVTSRLDNAETAIIKINTETIPLLQKVDADIAAKKDKLVHYTGILTTNIKRDVESRGIKWSTEVPEEFLDIMK